MPAPLNFQFEESSLDECSVDPYIVNENVPFQTSPWLRAVALVVALQKQRVALTEMMWGFIVHFPLVRPKNMPLHMSTDPMYQQTRENISIRRKGYMNDTRHSKRNRDGRMCT